MKIALCLEYPIHQRGGTEVLVRELIYGLAAKHQIVLVSNDDSSILRDPLVGSKIIAHVRWDSTSLTYEKSRQLAAALKTTGIDLAHFHFGGNYAWGNRLFNLCPIIHLARLGVPCLATNHGVFGIFDGYIGAQRSWLTKLALLPAAWLSKLQVLSRLKIEIAVSQNDYRSLRRRYWPLRGRFRQIYHSRLHEPPPPTAERSKHIICVGTVGPRKGQTFLTEAFCRIASRHPDWKLVLIGRNGDPSMMERIQILRREHGLTERIDVLGDQSDDEVNHWLRTAAIFAMPSVAEGLGLSLQEALFNGCACVTSRAGGTQDLIQNNDNGLLVEAADVDALSHALDRLVSQEDLRRRFSARGPISILEKEMTAEKMIEKYEQAYQLILHHE